MTPKEDFFINEILEAKRLPDTEYKIYIDEERWNRKITGIESLKQAIYKRLNTEKDEFIIYPTYGIKKKDLFGKPKDYAYLELRRRIEDALLLDDRILKVDNFKFHKDKSINQDLVISFTVHSIFEDIDVERGFRIENN